VSFTKQNVFSQNKAEQREQIFQLWKPFIKCKTTQESQKLGTRQSIPTCDDDDDDDVHDDKGTGTRFIVCIFNDPLSSRFRPYPLAFQNVLNNFYQSVCS